MRMWEKFYVFAHGTSNSCGALIAFIEGLNLKVISSHLNDNGRYVILKVEIQSSPFILKVIIHQKKRDSRSKYSLKSVIFLQRWS